MEAVKAERPVVIKAGAVELEGTLATPKEARSIVIFAHGSGSSRLSPRNRYVAGVLEGGGIGTLLFDLLTADEDRDYERRFEIGLLTERLKQATAWLKGRPECKGLRIGYFGASTGAAAALYAAAELGEDIGAVVSRGGRPDMASDVLPRVKAPTLLIVGGSDHAVLQLNRQALDLLRAEKELAVVPGATHLFEEPGTLEEAAGHALRWFRKHLGGRARTPEFENLRFEI